MFTKKRAQAAMEFLTTYGWSLLALSAVLGVMGYFGVFSLDARIPSQCSFDETFECTAFIAQEDGSFAFEIVNQLASEVNISKVLCIFPRTDTGILINLTDTDDEYILSRGENVTISCNVDDLPASTLNLKKKDRFQAKVIYHDNVAGSLPDLATAEIVSDVIFDKTTYNDYYENGAEISCANPISYTCIPWSIV